MIIQPTVNPWISMNLNKLELFSLASTYSIFLLGLLFVDNTFALPLRLFLGSLIVILNMSFFIIALVYFIYLIFLEYTRPKIRQNPDYNFWNENRLGQFLWKIYIGYCCCCNKNISTYTTDTIDHTLLNKKEEKEEVVDTKMKITIESPSGTISTEQELTDLGHPDSIDLDRQKSLEVEIREEKTSIELDDRVKTE